MQTYLLKAGDIALAPVSIANLLVRRKKAIILEPTLEKTPMPETVFATQPNASTQPVHPYGMPTLTTAVGSTLTLSGKPYRPILVIYHADCNDGLTAAWAVKRRFPDAELVPAKYQTPPPDVTGRHVIIVDFSYKRPVLLEMARKAKGITILDHHKSAEEDLRDIEKEAGNLDCTFDMNRSGAGIAWDEYHEGEPRPWFVNYIEHNDLWRHQDPKYNTVMLDCQAVIEFIRSFPTSEHMRLYDQWMADGQGSTVPLHVQAGGHAIRRAKEVMVQQTLTTAHEVTLPAGEARLVLYACNVPFFLASEVGNELAKLNGMTGSEPIGLTYYRQKDGRYSLSFRSDRNNGDVDVSAIARQFGGGGHRNAAGATVDRLPWAPEAGTVAPPAPLPAATPSVN